MIMPARLVAGSGGCQFVRWPRAPRAYGICRLVDTTCQRQLAEHHHWYAGFALAKAMQSVLPFAVKDEERNQRIGQDVTERSLACPPEFSPQYGAIRGAVGLRICAE